MNAHCERGTGSIRREALDHVLIVNETHTRHVLAAYQQHYNEHRPRRARNQLPPTADQLPITVHEIEGRSPLRTRILRVAARWVRAVGCEWVILSASSNGRTGWDYSTRRTQTGRSPTRAALKNLALRLARDNAG
ncbi:integrase core domain-containing protein [Kitasatospora sp. NPDC052896]|uniref:integrase core domain-containing protein n=1 Tax=Kitasatospora sp. NPDC052896 TaxID=3364061 RepID=UPI0037CB8B74